MTKIPVVFAADHNFVMPTCVALSSLLKNSEGETYDLYILSDTDVTSADRDILSGHVTRLSGLSSLHFIEISKDFDGGYEIRNISKAAYFRLLIPWLLPQYDKVIYADGDIVFTKGLKALYDIDLGDYYVGGCNTPGFHDGKPKKYVIGLGLDYKSYINSGVLLINAKAQLDNNLKDTYMHHSHNKYLYQDQDIINLVCKDRILLLSEDFNMSPKSVFMRTMHGESMSPTIIHYAGDKPWNTFTYCWNEWWDEYKHTLIFDKKRYMTVSHSAMDMKTFVAKALSKIKYKLLH